MHRYLMLAAAIAFLMARCTSPALENHPPSLKKSYKDDFQIGAALSAEQIMGSDAKVTNLIKKEFNTLTPENIMKWMHIHPHPDTFDFDLPDRLISLGKENGMSVVGHALVWHSQLAPWVETINDSMILAKHLENHITQIAGHFKDRIYGWDVVNEALNEDGSLRESIFLQKLGEDYIDRAFELTAKADPNAELYYNDYNIEQPAKRKGAIQIIKKLQDKGIKIDGVGIQGHWSINGPPLKEIEASILEYSALGIKVMFTELDLTALPNPWDLQGAEVSQNFEGSPFMNPYPEGLPDAMQIKLAQGYTDLFKLFLKHKEKISRVTFWGVHDGHSWLNGWPIKDRTNYPLLFDRNLNPKPAYHSVMALKEIKTARP